MSNTDNQDSSPKFPYIGLRPFGRSDSRIFFGREDHTNRLRERLEESNFVAVIGESGSGKSSLVMAGLIPELEAGFLVNARPDWRIIEFRPGTTPMSVLVEKLCDCLAPELKRLDQKLAGGTGELNLTDYINSTLEQSETGLLDLLHESGFPENENLLVYIDQFEEIFRFKDKSESEEIDRFISVMISDTSTEQKHIYVVLSMRSDFIGDCSQFEGLPERISQSTFLVPRLDRDQLTDAICRPAEVFGFKVAPNLEAQLYKEVSLGRDQLPIVQHALMRLHQLGSDSKTIEIPAKEKFRGISLALNDHVDEVYNDLIPEDQKIAKAVFRCITEKTIEGGRIRRPTSLSIICSNFKIKEHEASDVIEKFAIPENHFLGVNGGKVDITHESLIRKWEKLQEWVDDEAMLAHQYRRICTDALEWRSLKKTKELLLQGFKLENAEDWYTLKNKIGPLTKEWCSRNWDRKWADSFETSHEFDYARLVDSFLNESRGEVERERIANEHERQQEITKAKEERQKAVEDRDVKDVLLGKAVAAKEEAVQAKGEAEQAKGDAEMAEATAKKYQNYVICGAIGAIILIFVFVDYYVDKKLADARHLASNYIKHSKLMLSGDRRAALLFAFESYYSFSQIEENISLFSDKEFLEKEFSDKELDRLGKLSSNMICEEIEEVLSTFSSVSQEEKSTTLLGKSSLSCKEYDQSDHKQNVEGLRKEVCIIAMANLSYSQWVDAVGYTIANKSVTYPITCDRFPHGVVTDSFQTLLISDKSNSHSAGNRTVEVEIESLFKEAEKIHYRGSESDKVKEDLAMETGDLKRHVANFKMNSAAVISTGNKRLDNYLKANKNSLEAAVMSPEIEQNQSFGAEKDKDIGQLYISCRCAIAYEEAVQAKEQCAALVEVSKGDQRQNFLFERGLSEGLNEKKGAAEKSFNEHKDWVKTQRSEPRYQDLKNRVDNILDNYVDNDSDRLILDIKMKARMKNECDRSQVLQNQSLS